MSIIEVVNQSEPDEPVRFPTDGDSRLFGRDDVACDIVIWSGLRDPSLSRVAGRLWRMDGELWVRNLSTRHELVVSVIGEAASVLPPRHGPRDRGAARSLPEGMSVVLGPGGCELVVHQDACPVTAGPRPPGTATAGLPEIPREMVPVAVALCEPLVRGLPMPATYSEIARRLGVRSHKRVRLLVTALCDRYEEAALAPFLLVPGAETGSGRPEPDAAPAAVLDRGVWRFRPPDDAPAPVPPRPDLPLPRYVPVAQLLVRRGLVRREHLACLDLETARAG